ncbi:class I SAM-dependent methyltransferase [Salinibacillus xinjiangensis]|uniref:Uncharacterized methyltransferase GH754_05705 n=1 Tax=Salinibacillus xinjiangensis TaxID=1229268 RepID=A0A6G1X4M5_9BACI|nr:class I SAM-dependent methyltransferase [Salinibacillus xinjiangensis]MRG85830.1 methyltransferase domain-containing protein [Salinibacillus xinjiangensis]
MGREFVDLFNEWSDSYDETVSGQDIEYKKVFEQYDAILERVAQSVEGHVIEFGVGTGNLTAKLLEHGCQVTGVEPSPMMREKAKEKVPNVQVVDGDFLNFPLNGHPVDGVVSSYAFHHLTDDEKEEAIAKYARLLEKGGKIVFADTIFLNQESKFDMIKQAEDAHFLHLAHDLKTEYYTTIPTLEAMLEQHDFSVDFIQMNEFVWLLYAKKQ